MYSLLNDGMIGAQLERLDDPVYLTLPDIIKELRHEQLLSFTGLTPLQKRPWHMFLAQLDALVQLKGKGNTIEERLLSLTDGNTHAWKLVASDDEPAFLQPAFTYSSASITPQGSDYLTRGYVSKDFDVKKNLAGLTPEQAIFGLVEVQTCASYAGGGNYGISRMYSGFGTRTFVTATPTLHRSKWHNRDVRMLRRVQDTIDLPKDGTMLLWTKPWDGTESTGLDPYTLHPLFIEVCRLIRLTKDLGVRTKSTTSQRILCEDEDEVTRGLLSPIWGPINMANSKGPTAYNPGGSAPFSYRNMPKLIFGTNGDIMPSKAYDFKDGGDKKYIVCSVLCGGQCKTSGYHERIIEVPASNNGIFHGGAAKDRLRAESQGRLTQASQVNKILREALYCLLGMQSQEEESEISRAMNTEDFQVAVDKIFFEDLWSAGGGNEKARKAWIKRVIETAVDIYMSAEETATGAQKWRQLSKARGLLNGSLTKHFDYYVQFDAPRSERVREFAKVPAS